MLEGDNLDWGFWEPIQLFEEKLNLPQYAPIREGDKLQRQGYAKRAQPIYRQECNRCDKTVLEVCAAVHEAESHRAQGEWDEAIQNYRRAFECFHANDQAHNIAVAHLMLGLCYQAVAQYRDAMDQFVEAHKQFDLLLQKHRGQGNRRHVGKYTALCMQALLLQWQTRALANAAEAAAGQAGAEARVAPAPPVGGVAAERVWENNVVEVIPIFKQSLAAGSGVWMDSEERLAGYLKTTDFQIGDKRYHVVNLTDHSNYLRLRRDSQYGCVGVTGDSMNQRGIDPGDYIIIERLHEFQNGDLVAAALDDDLNRYGLIKQYKIARDDQTGAILEIRLEPRSSNPAHQARLFRAHNGDKLPDFIGKVLAVLKPIN